MVLYLRTEEVVVFWVNAPSHVTLVVIDYSYIYAFHSNFLSVLWTFFVHNGTLKLKEMVLATLTESEVTVTEDIVESIVEKVLNHMKPYIYPPSISIVSSI